MSCAFEQRVLSQYCTHCHGGCSCPDVFSRPPWTWPRKKRRVFVSWCDLPACREGGERRRTDETAWKPEALSAARCRRSFSRRSRRISLSREDCFSASASRKENLLAVSQCAEHTQST